MPDELDEEPTEAAAPTVQTAPTVRAPKTVQTTPTVRAPKTVQTPKATAAESGAAAPRRRATVVTGFGIGSAVLGVVAVVAAVLGWLIWTGHRADVEDRAYQTRVLQAAADWTGVLINMNKDTVTSSMTTLHDGTIGELNANFESAVEPFSQVVQKLQSQTVGQVEAVAIESLHHVTPGDAGLAPPQPELATVASRTDDVIVVATSISQNAGAKPLTVHWTLRLSVSDVDGRLLVSRLETIR